MFVFKTDKHSSIELLTNKKIGGVKIQGPGKILTKVIGNNLQMVKLDLERGYYHPNHEHSENESIGYLISGRLEMSIGGQIFILEPGDIWHHPIGVAHSTKAIENSEAIEVHSPPRKDLSK